MGDSLDRPSPTTPPYVVAPETLALIENRLDAIEREEGVTILLAVESGSRAWGFASTDSDYDVRFVYVHRPEWYLSIDLESKPDTMERPIEDEIDLSGWDIRKALRLLRKSNPPLLEWLQCPIVYRERAPWAQVLRDLAPELCSPRSCFYHYLHMAKGNLREYLQGETVWRKKYLYVLRPLIALDWIDRGLGPVPIEFHTLLNAILPAGAVRAAIDELIEAKKAGAELDYGPRIAVIDDFIRIELTRFAEEGRGLEPGPNADEGRLDRLFQQILEIGNG